MRTLLALAALGVLVWSLALDVKRQQDRREKRNQRFRQRTAKLKQHLDATTGIEGQLERLSVKTIKDDAA